MGTGTKKIALNTHVHLRTANSHIWRPERHVDDITDMRRCCWLRQNTSGRCPLGSSSRLLKVPTIRHKTREQHLFYIYQDTFYARKTTLCFFTVFLEALKMAIFWGSKGHRLQNACKVLNFLLLARKKRKALMQSLSRVLVSWNRCEYRERFQFPDIFGYF